MLARWASLLVLLFCFDITQAGAPSYYELMGVEKTASTQEIKRAFRRLGCILCITLCTHPAIAFILGIFVYRSRHFVIEILFSIHSPAVSP